MTLLLTTPVLSTGSFTARQGQAAVISQPNRTRYTDDEVLHLFTRTIHWCAVFTVNHDIVFAQMVHETDWFRFTGDVRFGQHNFAGLGATGGVPGHSFPTIDAGVLAVVAHHAVYRWGEKKNWPAHLQMYATNDVDPRYTAVLSTGNGGKMIYLNDYRGTWAVPGRTYPEAVITRSTQIAAFPRGEESDVTDIPGVAWVPADTNHMQYGRPVAWPDTLIQHHTDGFDSLNWLTLNKNSAVSAHYLLWHDGTIRAQLVRHKDTAWTTGYMNSRAISFEWERFWTDPARRQYADGVPDFVYRNIGESWARVVKAERERGNPNFQSDPRRNQLGDHNDYYNTACPTNLSTDRLYEEMLKALGSDLPAPPPPVTDNPHAKMFTVGGKDFWIINNSYNGVVVDMLDFYEENGGIVKMGLPLTGMWQAGDGVYRQVTEGAVMEFWPEGFGNQQQPTWRFGRYLDHADKIGA